MINIFNKALAAIVLLLCSTGFLHLAFCSPPVAPASPSDSQLLIPSPLPTPAPSLPSSLSGESQSPPHGSSGPSPSPKGPITKLSDNEIKSICGYLDSKSIISVLRSSKQCLAAVKGNGKTGLNTFTEGRKDTLYIKTSAQLINFLDNGTKHFYPNRLSVSIRSEEELDLVLRNSRLQSTLTFLTLNYIPPFTGVGHRETLAGLLLPFHKLTGVQINGDHVTEPTVAFSMISAGNIEAFKALILSEPKNLMISNAQFYTPLWLAVLLHRPVDLIRSLAVQVPEILKMKDHQGRTLCHFAVVRRNSEVALFLASYAPETMKTVDHEGNTLAHLAAVENNLPLLQYLAEHAPDTLKMQNQYGKTPAHLAPSENGTQTLRLLAEHALETLKIQDDQGNTPTHAAVLRGNLEAVRLLAEKAPDTLKVKNKLGKTPLEAARLYTNDQEIIQFLREFHGREQQRRK